jgi:type II secretory pathway pseudopilin PulG
MAVLLIALSVMGVMLSVAMPVWKQMAQREREAELVFRGQQYARAIGLFQRRAGPGALPPNLDLLVEQRFLRKKYKDPITGEDFQPLLAGQAAPGSPSGPASPSGGRGGAAPSPGQTPGGAGAPTGAAGGIQGVVSKSKAKSIRIYNGRNVYNEWAFVFVPQVQNAGGGAGGRGQGVPPGPGGRGGRGAPTGPGGFNPPGGPSGPGGPGGPAQPPRRPSPFSQGRGQSPR